MQERGAKVKVTEKTGQGTGKKNRRYGQKIIRKQGQRNRGNRHGQRKQGQVKETEEMGAGWRNRGKKETETEEQRKWVQAEEMGTGKSNRGNGCRQRNRGNKGVDRETEKEKQEKRGRGTENKGRGNRKWVWAEEIVGQARETEEMGAGRGTREKGRRTEEIGTQGRGSGRK